MDANEEFNEELSRQITGTLPKDIHEWLNWVSQGKALYLDLIETLMRDFENPR